MGRLRGIALSAVALGFAACGGGLTEPLPPVQVLLEVQPERRQVEVGAPFGVTVVRTWDAALRVEPWQDDALLPLAVTRTGHGRREQGGRVQERIAYRAHVFGLDALRVGPFTLEGVGEGGTRARSSVPAWTVTPRPTLDPEAIGALSVPAGPRALPRRVPGWLGWLAAGLGLVLVGWLLLRERRRRPPSAVARPADTHAAACAQWLAARPQDAPGQLAHLEVGVGLTQDRVRATTGLDVSAWTPARLLTDERTQADRAWIDALATVQRLSYSGSTPSASAYAELRELLAARMGGER